MTPQTKLVLIGGAAAGVSKFGFGKTWHQALLFGLAAISAAAILTAREYEK